MPQQTVGLVAPHCTGVRTLTLRPSSGYTKVVVRSLPLPHIILYSVQIMLLNNSSVCREWVVCFNLRGAVKYYFADFVHKRVAKKLILAKKMGYG